MWCQCLFSICGSTEERDAVQDKAHSFSMVFFVLADLQNTLQQALQNGPGSRSLEICVLGHLQTLHKDGPRPCWGGLALF